MKGSHIDIVIKLKKENADLLSELEHLKIRTDRHKDWCSFWGYRNSQREQPNSTTVSPLDRSATEIGIPPKEGPCKFCKKVKTYHAKVWQDAYDIDITTRTIV